MSDFLANFDKNNYKKTIDGRQEKKKSVKEKSKQALEPELSTPSRQDESLAYVEEQPLSERVPEETESVEKEEVSPHALPQDEINKWQQEISELMADLDITEEGEAPTTEAEAEVGPDESELVELRAEESDLVSEARHTLGQKRPDKEEESAESDLPVASRTSRGGQEETEVDPTYRKRKQRKIIITTLASILSALVLFFVYYSMTHVKLPKFEGKPVAEVRAWASEHKVKINLEQEYDFDKEVNTVVKQGVKAGKKIKKKTPLLIVASLGPDPEEVIPLPDFSKLTKTAAEEWVAANKAENLSILEEYNDKIEKNKFVRQEIKNKEVKPDTYKRDDQAVVYFSKGKEVFEKDISVPDFKGKPRSEVESWVKTNEIKMDYKKVDSDTVEEGLIVSQDIAKGKKIAKRDKMSVEVSTGKAVIVPNFAELTPETAATVEGLVVTVKEVFATGTSYGQLISQSLEAGQKISAKEPQKITVTYSAGQPYLRSYFGQLEGDLDKLFYTDYRSKGANIRFTTYYVDSAETKGTVVKMDAYNQYVALDYVVGIGISNGSKAGDPGESPETGDSGSEGMAGSDE